jgi:hypothetical protein
MNYGTDNDTSPEYPCNNSTQYANVVCVGAVDNQNNLADFLTLGAPPSEPGSDYGAQSVNLFAPGWNVYTTMKGSPEGYQQGYWWGHFVRGPDGVRRRRADSRRASELDRGADQGRDPEHGHPGSRAVGEEHHRRGARRLRRGRLPQRGDHRHPRRAGL